MLRLKMLRELSRGLLAATGGVGRMPRRIRNRRGVAAPDLLGLLLTEAEGTTSSGGREKAAQATTRDALSAQKLKSCR